MFLVFMDKKMIDYLAPTYQFGKNPRVVILGESHEHVENAVEQREIADILKPDFFIHEFLRNNMYDVGNKTLVENPDFLTPSKVRASLKGDMFFSIYPEENLERFNNWKKENMCISKMNAYDEAYFASDFFPSIEHHLTDSISSIKYFVGCDLAESHFNYLENKGQIGCPMFCDRANSMREERMGIVISEYANKTEKPLVVVLGAHHIRDDSKVHEIMKSKGIEYLVLDQTKDLIL